MSSPWLPESSIIPCDVCQTVRATFIYTRRGIYGSTVNYVCEADTCGNNDFLTRQTTCPEEQNAAVAFFRKLNEAAAVREATQ